VVVERDALISETYANMEAATRTKDLSLLQRALQTSIQLGLSDARIEKANQLREVLQTQEDEIARIVAVASVLENKLSSSSEIKQADVDAVKVLAASKPLSWGGGGARS
jgi:hypothetical protein